jgi:hypothetical protein
VRFRWRACLLPGMATGAQRADSCRFGIGCAAVTCCLAAAPAPAGEYASGGGYALSYDSNITRVSPDTVLPDGTHQRPRSEWTQQIFAGFAYQEHTVDVNTQLLAQMERRDYFHHAYTGDVGVYLNGAGVWTILPRFFSWSFEELYREARLDITAVDVPSNRVKTNTLTTGPDLNFRLDATNSAVLGARYGRFDIVGPGDNVRYSAFARWMHQMSSLTTLSLNYEPMRVYFQSGAVYSHILREDSFVRFETRPLPNTMTVDVGTTRVTREGAQDLTGRLARVTASRQLTPDSALQATLAEQYSDTFTDTLRGVTSLTVPGDTAILLGTDLISGDVYYSRRGELAYMSGQADSPMTYALRGYARRVAFQQLVDLDNDERGGRFDWAWRYAGQRQIYAYTSYLKRTFWNVGLKPTPPTLEPNQHDVERNTTVGATWGLNQNVTVSLEGGRIQRSTSGPLGGSVDWRAMLLLGYSTGPLFTARSRR